MCHLLSFKDIFKNKIIELKNNVISKLFLKKYFWYSIDEVFEAIMLDQKVLFVVGNNIVTSLNIFQKDGVTN